MSSGDGTAEANPSRICLLASRSYAPSAVARRNSLARITLISVGIGPFSIIAVAAPGITLSALLIVLGAFVFVDGVTAIALAITGESRMPRWVLLFDGVAGVIFAGPWSPPV